MKNIALLGSTGSVGQNVLDVVRRNPEKFRITAITANDNVGDLARQAEEFSPDVIAVGNDTLYKELKGKVPAGTKVLSGTPGICQIASSRENDTVFLAISGTAALEPLVAAIRAGKEIALASKEPIVSAGEMIMKLAADHRSLILPVDSEHSAIMQCLTGRTSKDIERLYITGSGGSLWKREKREFDGLSVKDVLAHPKWDMGRKITVDSATLMNKGLELIEARWLFDVDPGKIQVVIHPEAIIHAMLEFNDGTITASMFCPDMRFPILKALSYPDIIQNDLPRVDFSAIKNLSFCEPDRERFPSIDMARGALEKGGTFPAVLNAANEKAVGMFLDGEIIFTRITELVDTVLECHKKVEDPSLDDIIKAERWAQEEVLRSC
ncbi:MAG: 1-deoxy-D-xylulose-5-phosphate reductoisomerase [Candidatus Omnitrophota bacterium]|nr:1-deoxy-D-xylulose-5-phosphate reductoisomerase [Candidatus Omnitrophota bacterium]